MTPTEQLTCQMKNNYGFRCYAKAAYIAAPRQLSGARDVDISKSSCAQHLAKAVEVVVKAIGKPDVMVVSLKNMEKK